jgi:hypothetical protein
MRISTLFAFEASFDIDNGITGFVRPPYTRDNWAYVAEWLCPGTDPFDPNSDCNRIGDKRQIIRPSITIANTSPNSELWTDPMGGFGPQNRLVRQFVRSNFQLNLDTRTNFINGVDGGDIHMYRSLRYCADTNNCNPRNFSDGTVRPPN